MARPRSTLRKVGARIRRRAELPRAPDEAPGDLELLNRAPDDEGFITGNGIASRCGWVLNYGPPRTNDGERRDWCFCRTDVVEYFFARLAPKFDFVLFSHNSDLPVGRFRRHLRHRRLRAWFATNVDVDHPKLRPIPIGVANPRWPHGDTAALRRVQHASLPKTRLFDVSFAIETNPAERRHCVAQTGLAPPPPQPFEPYLADLASSYFCIAPRGNGIDTHRTWEALYVGTIPVVTRSLLTEHHADLPLVVLDDWAQFRSIEFSPEMYARLWDGWDPAAIRLDRYLERLAGVV